ncbi:MAG: 50S ribosomal protein L4 [Candidatus Lokiarchaeota archaeon]|nr:50S ribosomal protein L4 [Candidatus Lokiarchaeota archaeon]
MDKINVYNLKGDKMALVELPRVFNLKPRKDLIEKAAEVAQSHTIQPQGRNKRAGLRNVAKGWGTGHGMARTPRIKGSGFSTARSGGRVPYAKGGRAAHPIKVEKNLNKKINRIVNKASIASAISASGKSEWIKKRGHQMDNIPEIPLVIDDKVQTIKNTSKIYSILLDLGLKDDLLKAKKRNKKVRAGKGKGRGRKYKNAKSLLIVIKEDFGIVRAGRNIPGVDIVTNNNLSIEDLAPGGVSGRLILWTQSAFKELNNYEDLI